jgi:ribosome recycling factor
LSPAAAAAAGQHHSFRQLVASTTSSLPMAATVDSSTGTLEQRRSVSCVARQSVPVVFMNGHDDDSSRHHPFLMRQTQTQQLRWRHSSKIGHMKETLDELAHRPEREAAQEKRQKKKEKAAGKRKKKKGDETPAAAAATPAMAADDDDDEGDLDFLNDDDDHHDDDDDDDDEEDADAEPSLPDLEKVEAKMMTYIDRFQESLKAIRGAEPTAEMFDDIQVLAYGSSTPLKAVGQVVIVSPTLAQITCFDPAVAKDVQKAIQLSLDQLNPQLDEGGNIKVPLPRVSMAVREQTAKQLKKKAEATKQRIRQVRRKAMDLVKQGKDGKLTGISKDDAFASGKEIDTLLETVSERLQKLVDVKMNNIMAV